MTAERNIWSWISVILEGKKRYKEHHWENLDWTMNYRKKCEYYIDVTFLNLVTLLWLHKRIFLFLSYTCEVLKSKGHTKITLRWFRNKMIVWVDICTHIRRLIDETKYCKLMKMFKEYSQVPCYVFETSL